MSATSPRPAAALDPVLDVHFGVEDAGMLEHAAVPTLRFAVRIRADGERPIRSIMLDVQIQIAARRRSYDDAEKERLLELFGEAGRWSTTLRTLPWTRISQNVPGFTGETLVDLHVPCTYDFEVTAAKYLQALDDGEIPLEFLFSGTVMYMSEAGLLQMARISWERDAEYALPVSGVARDDGPLLPRQRAGCASRARRSTGSTRTARATRCRAGSTRSTRCWPRTSSRRRASRMDELSRIADAVLYEGYVLWPYSRSATKNQRRWTFGGVYPEAHSERASRRPVPDADRVPDRGRRRVHAWTCACGSCTWSRAASRARASAGFEPVEELTVGDEHHVAWDEATEREVRLPATSLGSARVRAAPSRSTCRPARASRSAARRRPDRLAGALLRSWRALRGSGRRRRRAARPGRPPPDRAHRQHQRPSTATTAQEALRQTFCSAHTILHARGRRVPVAHGSARGAARRGAPSARNTGTWPVLVGAEGERHTVLSSPIILPDYPQVAPESPGDMFDAAEIDQLLRLSILSMTEDEKREMRASDPKTRAILERTESLTQEELMRLHGTVREFGLSRRG